jgi:hypothetical protein
MKKKPQLLHTDFKNPEPVMAHCSIFEVIFKGWAAFLSSLITVRLKCILYDGEKLSPLSHYTVKYPTPSASDS